MFGNFPIKVSSIQKFALNEKKLRPLNWGLKPQKLGPHHDICLYPHFNIEKQIYFLLSQIEKHVPFPTKSKLLGI